MVAPVKKKPYIAALSAVVLAALLVFTVPRLTGHAVSDGEAAGPAETVEPAETPVPTASPVPVETPEPTKTPEPEATEEPGILFENFIFLGDSMIANPHYVSDVFGAHGHQVLAGGGAVIRQFFGVTEHYVTVGAETMGAMTGTLRDREFNGIVILLGANDVAFSLTTGEIVAENYRALLDELREAYDVPVFVLKVFPVGWNYANRYGDMEGRIERAAELNALLEEYCSDAEGVYFADATEMFTGEDGNLLGIVTGDGLHIASTYYELFYSEIERALRESGIFAAKES